jgi:hypothetical protein
VHRKFNVDIKKNKVQFNSPYSLTGSEIITGSFYFHNLDPAVRYESRIDTPDDDRTLAEVFIRANSQSTIVKDSK